MPKDGAEVEPDSENVATSGQRTLGRDQVSDVNTQESPPKKSGNLTRWWIGLYVVGILIWTLGRAIWETEGGKEWLTKWWPYICWVVSGLIFLGLLYGGIRWFRNTTAERRTGVIVFFLLPIIVAGVGATAWVEPPRQLVLLRCVFLIVVCLLPALIYYLFIASRKISLLNDYFINLNRLGLLHPRHATEAAKTECRVRLLNYLQKFEAIYGALPRQLEEKIGNANDEPLAVLADAKSRQGSSSGIVQALTGQAAIPVIVASILIALGWVLALPPLGTDAAALENPQSRSFWSVFLQLNEDPISYAFLGAYFFSLQMLFRRYVREDLRKSAYVAVSMRIILAVIGTWAAVTAVKAWFHVDSSSLHLALLGFVIGVFPRVAWQFIQGATKAFMRGVKFTVALPSLENRLPVSDLDGLTVWHESRLEEHDMENVPNMATAEIIDLMIGTRFPRDRIIDWVDQAILYTHLGPERKNGQCSRREAFRQQGITTATSLMTAVRGAERRNNGSELTKISDTCGGGVKVLIDAISTEPNLELICNWRGMPGIPQPSPP